MTWSPLCLSCRRWGVPPWHPPAKQYCALCTVSAGAAPGVALFASARSLLQADLTSLLGQCCACSLLLRRAHAVQSHLQQAPTYLHWEGQLALPRCCVWLQHQPGVPVTALMFLLSAGEGSDNRLLEDTVKPAAVHGTGGGASPFYIRIDQAQAVTPRPTACVANKKKALSLQNPNPRFSES